MAKKSFKLVKASAALAVTAAALTPVMAAEASTSTVELKPEVVLGGKFKEALALNTPKGVEIKWGKYLVTAINKWQTVKGQGSDGKTYIKKLYPRNYPLYIIKQDLGEVEAGSELKKPSIRVMYRDGKIYTQAPERFSMSSNYNTKDEGEQKVLISYNHNGNRITSFLTYTVVNKDVAGAISSAKALGKTTVEVALNQEVDAVSAANFSIAGANVTSATLKADKKTVALEVSGLDYAKDYVVAANNIMVKGEAKDFGSKAFKSLAVNEVWNLKVTPKASTLLANGSDNTEVTLELVDAATGRVDAGADNIVLDLNATFGALSSKRVTIQDGKATVVLTSEFSNTGVTSKIDAQIIEASGDYKALIGKVAGTANVTFATSTTGAVDTITLVNAESNQADRFTLFFDKEVSLDHFVKKDANGKYVYTNGSETSSPVANQGETYRHALRVDGADQSVEITQGGKTFVVKGFKPVAGNPKAMEVILDKGVVLTDNARVEVEVNTVNSINKVTKSSASFVVTDARKPEATSATPEGLNTLKVKFSEAIADATFVLDGRFVEGTHFDAAFGDFNPVTLADNRDLATLTLKAAYNEGGSNSVNGFFGAGQHSVQISSMKDFAFATDSANLGSTQNLNFNIVADSAKPSATVTVESPEQFRVKFDKSVAGFDGSDIQVQRKGSNGSYTTVPVSEVPYTLTQVSASEYVIELTSDWTQIYNTSATNKNYYNDEYRIFIAKDAVTNVANGLKNEDLALSLNYSGSPLNTPDVTSPVISQIERVEATRFFNVTMSEPVKYVGADNAGDTLAQTQASLAGTTVQFIGKDKEGKTVTINGSVTGYANNANGMDNVLRVEWSNAEGALTPQAVVDGGGATEWTLVVRAISDDVGNTAASATKSFTVAKSPAANTPFAIATNGVSGALNGSAEDTVVIKFTEGVLTSGVSDATNPAQYTLNGKTLPSGTSIRVSNNDAVAGFETVTITLPDGTVNTNSNVITVNKDLVSYDGSLFQGPVENTFTVTLP